MGDCGAFRCAELRHEKGAGGFFFHTMICLTFAENRSTFGNAETAALSRVVKQIIDLRRRQKSQLGKAAVMVAFNKSFYICSFSGHKKSPPKYH